MLPNVGNVSGTASGTASVSDSEGKVMNVQAFLLTHNSGRVTQICVFNTVKLGTSASSP